MNKPVAITYDSTCDLSPELLQRFGIHIAPLSILVGEERYLDDGGYTCEHLFERYRADGTLPQTAAVSPQGFVDFFRPMLEAGYEVVHLDISSELSSTYQNACLAAAELSDLGKVYCVDTRHLSTGGGLLALQAADMRDAGMAAADIADRLRSMTDKVDTSFVLDTLEYMWKGGRCSGVAALGANLLKLKPCLEMRDGVLVVGKKYRGNMEKVYRQYVAARLEGADVREDYAFVTNSTGMSRETLDELVQLVKDTAHVKEVFITEAGCTIASHCGPRCLGVLFLHK
ncbi:MAG: DegV family protein [Clostridiales bacterium]|nr:DegV family protein [Candidatus Cacconaster stercorequi]